MHHQVYGADSPPSPPPGKILATKYICNCSFGNDEFLDPKIFIHRKNRILLNATCFCPPLHTHPTEGVIITVD